MTWVRPCVAPDYSSTAPAQRTGAALLVVPLVVLPGLLLVVLPGLLLVVLPGLLLLVLPVVLPIVLTRSGRQHCHRRCLPWRLLGDRSFRAGLAALEDG